MSKSLLQLKAEEHLNRMYAPQRASIRMCIRNRTSMFPFIVEDKWMYFLQNDELVCVSLQQENGVYHFWFNSRIIQIYCQTGKIFIVDFNKNCLEYFCVDDFFQNEIMNKHHNFLYLLLIRERIERMNQRAVRSFHIFFTTREVVGQIERAGQSSLKPPLDCLSIQEMVQGIKLFIADRVSACFTQSPCPNIFRIALLTNHVPFQRPSVDQFYGMGLFLTGEFQKPLPSFAMISLIMRRFVGNDSMRGLSGKRIANGFLRMMNGYFSSMMSEKFIENPIGFQKTDEMDYLLKSCPKKTTLTSFGFPDRFIEGSVSDMNAINKGRDELCQKRRDDWFAEQRRLEQEEHQRKQSIQEFQGGIASIKVEVSQTQKRRRILDEFESGGDAMMNEEFDETKTRKRGREYDELEDACSFLKFGKIKKFE